MASGTAGHTQIGCKIPERYMQQNIIGIEITNDQRGTDPWYFRGECMINHSRETMDQYFLSLFVMTMAKMMKTADYFSNVYSDDEEEDYEDSGDIWGGG